MAAIIAVNDLTKSYGRSRGVTHITFSVEEGSVFGFLGPNGAGKTTTIRTLMGLLHPTAGHASVGGLDCWEQAVAVKRLLGYVPGELALDPNLTGGQILEYFANLRGGVEQAYLHALVDRLELDPSKRFREYSSGNKRKVGLAQAFMHKPKLLILDEPTNGLDPLNQQEFYRMVAEVKGAGRTIFLSSHNLPEVEHTCDHVGIIREGELVRVADVSALKDLKHHLVEFTFDTPPRLEAYRTLPGVTDAQASADGRTVQLRVQGDLRAALRLAGDQGAVNLVTHEPSLEEIFLRYYQGPDGAASASDGASDGASDAKEASDVGR
jgi:ABC-2 type transport system ATP-binding protein